MCCVVFTDSPLEEQRFFVANNTSGDDDAVFKERLKNMGKGMKILYFTAKYLNDKIIHFMNND